jgi:phospholipid/cholesterol/gamma-HCH transport system substrate-binding protein
MSTTAKVGAFFLVVLVIAGLMIWKIEDIRLGRGGTKKVTVQFADVSGLAEKSIVRVAGVPVGKVAKIRLEQGRAYVDIDLDRDVDLRQGASASIASLGLLGEKYVELVPGPVGATRLPENAVITGDVPVTFDEITRLARDIERDIKEISSNLNQSLGGPEGEERLRTIVENVRIITDDLRVMVASNRAGVDATVANFSEFSGMMTKLVDRIDRLVASNESNVTGGIANIREISGKLQTTADNLNAITNRINQGEGTVGKLVTSEETHTNLNDALVAVKEGVGGLNKALGRIGKIRFDMGLRSEYLVTNKAGKGKGYFSVDIDPVDSPRFYRLELSTQPEGLRETTVTREETIFPDGHTEVTTTTTNELEDDFAISALVGYRWNDLVLRGGIIESRGGGGVDYNLLKNRLRLSADMWDFSRPDDFAAHAKVEGRYYLSPGFFVSGGWDDFLNVKRDAASVFFGAGIRWNDEDIKYLLGSIPIRP